MCQSILLLDLMLHVYILLCLLCFYPRSSIFLYGYGVVIMCGELCKEFELGRLDVIFVWIR